MHVITVLLAANEGIEGNKGERERKKESKKLRERERMKPT